MARLLNVLGDARLRSPMFSDRWVMTAHGEVIAELVRHPRLHTSSVMTTEGTFVLVPREWGTVVAYLDEQERARIERASWWGRRWELKSTEFSMSLTSDPMPRRWTLRVGNEPMGRLAGGWLTYNRLDVHTDLSVPIIGIALAWHVVARPWEQASAPRSLVPIAGTPEAAA